MIYLYHCPQCDIRFDVIKSVREYDNEEKCKCGTVAIREFAPRHLHLSGTKVQEAEYNPGLGCWTKNKQDRAEIAKRKGLTEIGNDFASADNVHKEYEKKRQDKWEQGWDNATKGWVGNGE